MINLAVVLHLQAELGEGLHWDVERGCLWCVDITGRRIMNWRPTEPAHREWLLPQRVGWVIPLLGQQGVLAGLQQGVARVQLGDGAPQFDWVCRLFADAPQLRLNDAKADSTGALWAGSLNHDDELRSDGCLFRIDAGAGTAVVMDAGYQVANGPAIHPGGRWMLHNDSGRRTVYAFDLDAELGTLANRRVWKVLSDAEGYPDGMTFDAEGGLWLAHWGVGCVSRYAETGELLRRIQLPTSHITNVCFGGDGLGRLFVTSAKAGLSAAQLAAQPLAGALFELDAGGVRGLPGLPARG